MLYTAGDKRIIRRCTISGFREGLKLSEDNNPLVESCIIEESDYGVYLCCHQSNESNPNPDFGGGARGSAGFNIIRNNTERGLSIELDHPIYAENNTWTDDPPLVNTDCCVQGAGG